LIDVCGSREIVAGVEPAHQKEQAGKRAGGLAHDVSILPGAGRHLGSQPRANTSMTIMRAPQCGHGQASTRGSSGESIGAFEADLDANLERLQEAFHESWMRENCTSSCVSR
jgi:hypothetical protein